MKDKFNIWSSSSFIVIITSTALLVSCQENDPEPFSDNEYVNTWIYEELDFWYFWQSSLRPDADKGLVPGIFFNLQKSEQDRFSYIVEDYNSLINTQQSISLDPGFRYSPFFISFETGEMILQISYVKPNSPSSELDINRGDVITEINGAQITESNYFSIISAMNQPFDALVYTYDTVSENLANERLLSITPEIYKENPNYLDSIYTIGDKRIGYVVYNSFTNGLTESPTIYTDQLIASFSKFKQHNITDLIVDLRYNRGGAESAATALGSLIAPGINAEIPFAVRKYNDNVQELILNDPELGQDFLETEFRELEENVGNLIDSKVVFLTGSSTASASELVINSLLPFMNVKIIGDITVGKNVGSIAIYDEEDDRNNWGLQPIVVQFTNSLGESDFLNGFQPDILNPDNRIFKFELGDVREELLALAINEITGTNTSARYQLITKNKTISPFKTSYERESVIISDLSNELRFEIDKNL